jgi:phosphoglycerate dehydrogenase-like enzyme
LPDASNEPEQPIHNLEETDAINNKIIAGAGIDVYPNEPLPPNNPYIKLKNVTLTPHVSAGTVDALKTKIDHVCANINRYINGEKTLHSLNRDKIKDKLELSFVNAEG